MRIIAGVTLLAAMAAGGGTCLAQGGQRGAFEDMMKVYSNLLADPSIDPQMRAQLQRMLQQVTKDRDDLSSLGPVQNYRSPPVYQPPRYVPPAQVYTPPQQDQAPRCQGCVNSAR